MRGHEEDPSQATTHKGGHVTYQFSLGTVYPRSPFTYLLSDCTHTSQRGKALQEREEAHMQT